VATRSFGPRDKEPRPLDPDEAVALLTVEREWLVRHTKGLAFRRDFSRKTIRFDEAGLRKWGANPARLLRRAREVPEPV
jgi:hypothetical protein